MRNLSQIILFLLLPFTVLAQSPHGDDFNLNCEVCHSPKSWDIIEGSTFNHDSTDFALIGQHQNTDCRLCHLSLTFKAAETSCNSCHSDIHKQTVGSDCEQCHTSDSWIVTNVTQMHLMSRFPLLGAHAVADCYDCHKSAALLQFDPLGVDCYDCHKQDFMATRNPSHVSAGFSTECTDCHTLNATSWSSDGFNHSFFPLTQGHDIQDCAQCHEDGSYTNTSAECASCHTDDFTNTTNPSHVSGGFSTECDECHTTVPGWSPARYIMHDANWFPIYSGDHNGEWASCAECHTKGNDFTQFDCTACHEHNKTDMDDEHRGVSGYAYNSSSCYACHPNGRSDGAFNHDLTNFPLTGAHRNAECLSCHSEGYEGTSMECNSCHTADYVASQDPPHQQLGFPVECEECHNTQPGWEPATFAIHDEYYPLRGAHALVVSDCKLCHAAGYNNTPSECIGCHQSDFNGTANPAHATAKFPTDCDFCHNLNAWTPSSFNHDGQYFPIYSGTHRGEWSTCVDCHTNASNFAIFACTNCHEHNKTSTDKDHKDVRDYVYNSVNCFECHPRGKN